MTGESRAGRADSLEGGGEKVMSCCGFVLEGHDKNHVQDNEKLCRILSCFKSAVCNFPAIFLKTSSHMHKIGVEWVQSFLSMHI